MAATTGNKHEFVQLNALDVIRLITVSSLSEKAKKELIQDFVKAPKNTRDEAISHFTQVFNVLVQKEFLTNETEVADYALQYIHLVAMDKVAQRANASAEQARREAEEMRQAAERQREKEAEVARNRAMEEEIRRVAQENARNREVNEEAMRAAREAAYEKATVNIEIERIRKSLKWNTALAALFWVVFVYAALYTVGAFSAEQYDLFWDGFFFLVIMSLPGVWIYSTRKKLSAKLQLATVYLAGLEL